MSNPFLVAVIVSIFVKVESKGIQLLITDCPTIQLDHHVGIFTLGLSEAVSSPVEISVTSDHPSIAYVLQDTIEFTPEDGTIPKVVFVYGNSIGAARFHFTYNDSQLDMGVKPKSLNILVAHSLILTSIIQIIGWSYFMAWSIAGYPQIYINFKTKSVVGLNFDFLCYNVTGFLAYSFYNVGLYYFKTVQDEYFERYPKDSVIPVLSNDVFFALYALVLLLIVGIQCCIYERGNQKISLVCKILMSLVWLFALCALVPTIIHKITWLTYLNFFSYVKLGMTLIKYIPQVYMNYQRKSTVGWSIWGVIFDFAGGSLSLIQMFLLAYNYDEWDSIFGDFTKFGLGLLTIFFDIIFLLQHYIFYSKPKYRKISKELHE